MECPSVAPVFKDDQDPGKKMRTNLRTAKKIVTNLFPTAKCFELGDALRRGGGYGFRILAHGVNIGRKGRTENEAWRNALREIHRRLNHA